MTIFASGRKNTATGNEGDRDAEERPEHSIDSHVLSRFHGRPYCFQSIQWRCRFVI